MISVRHGIGRLMFAYVGDFIMEYNNSRPHIYVQMKTLGNAENDPDFCRIHKRLNCLLAFFLSFEEML